MLRNSRPIQVELLASAGVTCVCLVAACAVAHFFVVRVDRQRAYSEHLADTARVGAVAIESVSQDRSPAATRERFTRWAWAVTTDSAIVGAALLDPHGEILELQPEDLGDRSTIAEAVTNGPGKIDLGTPLQPLELSIHDAADGMRLVLFARPFDHSPHWVASSWPFLMTIVIGVCLVLTRLRRLFERSVVVPLRCLIETTAGGAKTRSTYAARKSKIEFRQLARDIEELIDDNKTSHARLRQLKRTMDARVAHQTRHIQAMLKRAERQAWIDPLTKLGNRRLLEDRLEGIFTDHSIQGEDMAVILFDLDNFKSLNDTLGHAAGDEVLSFVGELLGGSLRSSDIGLRLGGDEFAILLLGTSIEEAVRTADRLVKLFAQRSSLYPVKPRVGVSAGVASLKYHRPENGIGLVAAADAGLYRAKRTGKSRVGIAPRSLAVATSLTSTDV